MTQFKKSIGIDLGTTYSCVMHVDSSGQETVVQNAEGNNLTPSVVYIADDGECYVGQEAKNLLASEPDNTIAGIKREMGQDYPMMYAGKTYTPEGISALILSSLAQDAVDELGVPKDKLHAVITVPAYFGVGEKEATAAAAQIAGLYCAELVPEPVAAAFAYSAGNDPTKTSLVYDLGGGTLDVAVVGLHQGQQRVWAVDGESQLGGLDWDGRIQNLLWDKIDELDNGEDLRLDEDVIVKVETASETLKKRLTGAESVTERLRFNKETIHIKMSREDFENETRDLLQRSLEAVNRAIVSARRNGSPEPNQVLLVGGSTRMPMIRKALEEHLQIPVLLTDPDKAVAYGAAILSAQLLSAQTGQSMMLRGQVVSNAAQNRITPVIPRSLGIKIHSSQEPWREESYIQHLIHANQPLPIKNFRYQVATIVNGQERARVQIFEQGGVAESDRPEDNKLLVDSEVLLAPNLPEGSPVTITLSISLDGRISLQAQDPQSGRLEFEAFIHGVLDETEIAEQTQNTTSLMLRR